MRLLADIQSAHLFYSEKKFSIHTFLFPTWSLTIFINHALLKPPTAAFLSNIAFGKNKPVVWLTKTKTKKYILVCCNYF